MPLLLRVASMIWGHCKSLYIQLDIRKGDPVMRERTTWNREVIVKLANSLRKAEDPTAMNQDHIKQQPAADKYETGDPSSFAEDVAPNNWKSEYSDGTTKRDEIGLPELRSDTFNHAEKTAAEETEEDEEFLEKKADVCIRLARKVLSKTASESVIEDQALAFMHLPNEALIDTVTRLAAEGDEEEQAQAQKQAGEVPPQFKENVEKMKEKAKDKEDDGQAQQKQAQQQDDQAQDQAQQKQAQDQQQADEQAQQKQAQQDEQVQDQGQQKQAQQDQIAQLTMQAQQINDQIAQLQQAQMQTQSQAQQIAQAVQQAIANGQDPAQAVQQCLAQGQQGQDDQLLDQMLQQEQPVMASDTSFDIELEGTSMDTGDIHLAAGEDEILRSLFASDQEVQDAQEAQQAQQVQASARMGRTASTRTIGTRPSAGVSKIGGGASAGSGGELDKLSGLWNSAPDVSKVFSS